MKLKKLHIASKVSSVGKLLMELMETSGFVEGW